MAIQDLIARVRWRLRARSGKPANPYFPFAEQELAPSESGRLLASASCDLERLIYSHQGRVVHKWLHYPKIYARELEPFRSGPVNFLEIGIFMGGSLEIWRKYFGADAAIAGIDIEPACAACVDPPNRVFIGSQADPEFLRKVVREIGAPNLILDDGSHIAEHQLISFKTLFPLLQPGGLYLIEDLHTAYWPGYYRGGYRRKGTGIELAKTLVDDMHGWYHANGCKLADKQEIASVRFYDSLVVIEKGDVPMPQHIKVS